MRWIVQCPITFGDHQLAPGDEIEGDLADPDIAVLVSAGGLSEKPAERRPAPP